MIGCLRRKRPNFGTSMSKEELDVLARLAGEVASGCIVEIGSFRGRSANALARGALRAGRDTPIYAIDPHGPFIGVNGGRFGPEDRGMFYRGMLKSGAYRQVRLVNLPSTVVASAWQLPVGLIFIDGDHRYEAVRGDLHAWVPHLTDTATVAMDDMQNEGPAKVADQAIAEGLFEPVEKVGKMLVMRRVTPASPGGSQ